VPLKNFARISNWIVNHIVSEFVIFPKSVDVNVVSTATSNLSCSFIIHKQGQTACLGFFMVPMQTSAPRGAFVRLQNSIVESAVPDP